VRHRAATKSKSGGIARRSRATDVSSSRCSDEVVGIPKKPRTDQQTTRTLVRWFGATRRDLPWRAPPGKPRDPYLVLVSETMLQQTQVSRVIEKYTAFIERFPTITHLAAAPIDEVTTLWAGLGYYRRARNLHAAAKAVADRFEGKVPRDIQSLLELPGVGRYTAGAVASIAFRGAEPAVDGNVQRVLMRLEGVALAPTSKEAHAWVWQRATELVRAAPDPGEWNEGLMELGATVCTPKSPRCPGCPLQSVCVARQKGLQAAIPAAKPRKTPRDLFHTVALVRDGAGRVLVEQRPPTGMWAGLWQPPTVERDDRWATPAEIKTAVGGTSARRVHDFDFQTTHRTVRVRVFEVASRRALAHGLFADPERLVSLGVSNLTKRVLLASEM
jgi:A/G-specific adenine glycosylase